ncbi:metal-dependent transcriptional regulator [Methanocella sp. CWC-04]|uniref:Metal-dependent transcriptional regulator n=1 Tax=Methanooceanicella nereidis TaxID=2052831 RepID=A0AAP2W5Y8_9EURY|nr:metal-dependent transcriptional regulator [Methanocella sp. CWC-04]MCD1294657.1 metal-dependent transcriptional regulator [Methanocella sp. CWC-04]
MKKNVVEEYLETILYLTRDGKKAKTKDIADILKIKPPSVTEMLLKLQEEGYVDYEPYSGASLTEKGMEKGINIARKHQLLEKFLVDNLGVDADRAHREACEMEHAISDATTEKLCEYLGHPRFCPDENPITMGECCEKDNGSIPLTDLKEGEMAVIKVVRIDENNIGQHLMSLGFLPDVSICIRKRIPANGLLVRIKGTEIAIGRDIAEKIFVIKATA